MSDLFPNIHVYIYIYVFQLEVTSPDKWKRGRIVSGLGYVPLSGETVSSTPFARTFFMISTTVNQRKSKSVLTYAITHV